MFRAFSRSSSGAQRLQQQTLVLPVERGGSSAVGRGRAGRPAVNKPQDNRLKNCCIWLVIYLNFTMMQGLTNIKFRKYFCANSN
jgi:hypothetical protein